ncbi:hypothetical protein BGZ60DRAFT_53610 [Tricladium varicosporioides]|nr:hypothetical protein BGZ60DRAFT_53610 [Hymenoscyphus varicosporioides]
MQSSTPSLPQSHRSLHPSGSPRSHPHSRPSNRPRSRSSYTNPYPPQSPACILAVVTLFLETPVILLYIAFLEFGFSMYGIGQPGGRRQLGALLWVEISAWVFTISTLIALWVQYIMVGTDNITPKRVFQCQIATVIACFIAITLEMIALFLGYSKESGRQPGRGGDNVDQIPGYIWLTSMVGIPFLLGTVIAAVIWYYDHAAKQAALATLVQGVEVNGEENESMEAEDQERRSLREIDPIAEGEGERRPLLSAQSTRAEP